MIENCVFSTAILAGDVLQKLLKHPAWELTDKAVFFKVPRVVGQWQEWQMSPTILPRSQVRWPGAAIRSEGGRHLLDTTWPELLEDTRSRHMTARNTVRQALPADACRH
jgi:hypothetical protein